MQAVLLLVEVYWEHFVSFHQGKRNKLGRLRHMTRIRPKYRDRPLSGDSDGDLIFTDSSHAHENLAQTQLGLLFLALQGRLKHWPIDVSSRN
jgi:hypothetical protein